MSATSIPRHASSAAWREVDGETILLDTAGRTLRGLNGTGGAAWRLANGTRTIGEIARLVADSVAITPIEQVSADVLAFFNELREIGVIVEETARA